MVLEEQGKAEYVNSLSYEPTIPRWFLQCKHRKLILHQQVHDRDGSGRGHQLQDAGVRLPLPRSYCLQAKAGSNNLIISTFDCHRSKVTTSATWHLCHLPR